MSETGDDLPTKIELLRTESIVFLSGLSTSDLDIPCDDLGGSTVGQVVSHLGEGVPEVLKWLDASLAPVGTAAAAGPVHGHGPGAAGGGGLHAKLLGLFRRHRGGSAAGHGHDHGHGHAHGHDHPHPHPHPHGHGTAADPMAQVTSTIALLDSGLADLAERLRTLPPVQLERTPPAAPGITDGTVPLGRVVSLMADHQFDHLGVMSKAVAAGRAG